ncbi:MAG: carbohydrate-binding protein [Gammaproteobacteria bacterium]|nr:carbohydrate-binding protein [Gammaproteobacteria bacterium]
MIRFLFAVASIFIVTSTLALADCNPNTEVTSRGIHQDWQFGTVDLLEGDVSLIIALRAKLCGNLKHINFGTSSKNAFGGDSNFQNMNVYGWSDTKDDKLVYSVRVAAGREGTYKANLLLDADDGGNVFEISANSTSGTVAAEGNNRLQYKLSIEEIRIPMTGTITLNAGVNEIEVKLTTISSTQTSRGSGAGSSETGLGVLAIELIKEDEYATLLERGQTFPDMSWYAKKGTWGLFVHHSPWGTYPHQSGTHKDGGTYTAEQTQLDDNWEKFVNDFEVPLFVDAVESMGASYVAWTIFHAFAWFPGPSKVIDDIMVDVTPKRTTERDLMKELGNELEARGMRLLFYFHPGKDDGKWREKSGYDDIPNARVYHNNIINLHTEWASRYNGTNGYPRLGSTGIYIDAFWQGPVQRMFPFKRFVDAIKAPGRLPNAIIAVSNQHTLPPTLFNDVVVEDFYGNLVTPDRTLYDYHPYDHQPRVTPPHTMLGQAPAAVVKLQNDWYYWNRGGGWGNGSRQNLWSDGQLVAFISYANGMGAPVFLNSIVSSDVRTGVQFMSQRSIDQMQNVTRLIINNLRSHVADDSEFNRLTYTGDWSYAHHGPSFNFTRSSTTANGASVEFTFDGPEIRVFASQVPSGGDVEVFIDGTSKETVSTGSTGFEQHQVKIFENTSLGAGEHTIRLVKRSGSEFHLDYFQTEILEELCP